MTHAECEIVANAGVQLREIAERLTLPPSFRAAFHESFDLMMRMDAAALSISEVYGQLSALPLENETEAPKTCRWFGCNRPRIYPDTSTLCAYHITIAQAEADES